MAELTGTGARILGFAILIASLGTPVTAQQPTTDQEGVLHLPAVNLAPSGLMSADSRAVLERARKMPDQQPDFSRCGKVEAGDVARARTVRNCQADVFYGSAAYRYYVDHFPVNITTANVGGVYVEIFTPKSGISAQNRNRVLINVHGGAFLGGSRIESRRESMPIAALGKVKVVSIDYRMGPEYHFPAASRDVEAVYRDLLKSHRPKQIGIYGCSAGGLLTAESVAWLADKGLPRPGAVAMLCNAAAYWMEGDSAKAYEAMPTPTYAPIQQNAYFAGINENDPLAFPIRSDAALAKFPPALLIGGTRDFGLSSIVATHGRLVALGVEADLHVYEGLGHAFQIFSPELAESKDVYRLVTAFFDKHLER